MDWIECPTIIVIFGFMNESQALKQLSEGVTFCDSKWAPFFPVGVRTLYCAIPLFWLLPTWQQLRVRSSHEPPFHFESSFFLQHTNDFPLYTEAIKFFNHSESMVRIAVRTLTLNVYRIDEESMLKFVIDKTAVPYFSNLVWFIGNHILDMDSCVRNDVE